MAKDIRAHLLEFFRRPDFDRSTALPAFNFDTAAKTLARAGKLPTAEAVLRAVKDPELGTAVIAAATKVIEFLSVHLPRRERLGLEGAEQLPPTGQAQARFARLWSVACDPMIVLRDLREGCLTVDMAKGLAEMYPAIFRLVKEAMTPALVEMKAHRKTWQLPILKDRQIRVLIGAQHPNVQLANMIQASYVVQGAQDAADEAKQKNKPLKIDPSKSQSASERIEAG